MTAPDLDISMADDSIGRPPLALIAGPTASGKSALALRIAQAVDGVVINADASQVYADLQILSARPTVEEMGTVPHRLFGYIDGAEACSAARWASDAKAAIAEAHQAGKVPVLVGGTGLYLRTLLEGIAPVPDIAPEIRAQVRALAVADAHAALSVEDPAAAMRLNPADTTRVARALEVVRSTGRPLADWQMHKSGGIAQDVCLHPLVLLPDRAWLVARCDARFDTMMQRGAADEVRTLLRRELSPDLPVMRAIGVPPLAAWVRGEISVEYAVERARLDTRQYAKRQYTWFAHQPPADWRRCSENDCTEYVDQIIIKLQT